MAVVGSILAAGLAALVLYLVFAADGDRDEWVLTLGPEGDLTAFTLPVGACASGDLTGGAPVEVAAVVPCSGPHDLEVAARHDLVAAAAVLARPSPLDDDVLDAADRGCMTAFEVYVDAPYFSSDLDYRTVVPDQRRWAAGEREVICLVVPWMEDRLVGAAEGSGR